MLKFTEFNVLYKSVAHFNVPLPKQKIYQKGFIKIIFFRSFSMLKFTEFNVLYKSAAHFNVPVP